MTVGDDHNPASAPVPPPAFENGMVRIRRCRHGSFMYLASDIYVGLSLELYGEYSETEVTFFRQVIRPGAVVVDCGAHIGALTVPLAHLVGPQGRVVAFEPQRQLFQLLCGNVALNNFANVYCYQRAVAETEGSVVVPLVDYTQAQNFGLVIMGNDGPGERVMSLPIDALNLPACHFMKIDVQGNELGALKGAARTIAAHRPVLYVENDVADKSDALIAHLLSLNYQLWRHTPHFYDPGNFFGRVENVFGNRGSFNLICFPAELRASVGGLPPIRRPSDWEMPT